MERWREGGAFDEKGTATRRLGMKRPQYVTCETLLWEMGWKVRRVSVWAVQYSSLQSPVAT